MKLSELAETVRERAQVADEEELEYRVCVGTDKGMIEFCGEKIYCGGELPAQMALDPGGKVAKPIFVVSREMYELMESGVKRQAELVSNMPEKMPKGS